MLPLPVSTPALPDLLLIPCPSCEEGAVLQSGGTPFEHYAECEDCGGLAEIEVCSRCLTRPDPVTDACLCNLPPVIRFGVEAGWLSFEEAA